MGVLTFSAALAVVSLQLILFLPAVSSGRAIDFGPYRSDGVALVFGTAWAVALAIASSRISSTRQIASMLLILAGLLSVAYAREPLVLYVGWEVATAGLWLAIASKPGLGSLPAAIHLAGVPLLAATLLGLIKPFAPPVGGAAQPWHSAIALMFAAVVLLRIWLALLTIPTTTGHRSLVTGHWLYTIAAPILLVKALVAAPFDPFGLWILTLVGTLMLLVGAWFRLARGAPRHMHAFGWVWTGCIVAALGLATGSPLAAAGAVWLMLIGAGLGSTMGAFALGSRFAGNALAVALPGLWLIAQGALDLRYGLVAALLLPCLLVAIAGWTSGGTTSYRLPAFVVSLALTVAIYPQLPVELAVRPAVQAMAGGVSALSTLAGDWGVGLMVRPTQARLSAGLPATGIMVALFFAFVTLYWLKRLVRQLSRRVKAE